MLEIGLTAQSRTTASECNSALALGSGDMNVFATPAMVALMENAAMMAVSPELEEGQSTVGVEITTSHIKASAMGAEITASATLVAIDKRMLTFKVEAHEGDALIGEGTHKRCIVDRERFLQKIQG